MWEADFGFSDAFAPISDDGGTKLRKSVSTAVTMQSSMQSSFQSSSNTQSSMTFSATSDDILRKSSEDLVRRAKKRKSKHKKKGSKKEGGQSSNSDLLYTQESGEETKPAKKKKKKKKKNKSRKSSSLLADCKEVEEHFLHGNGELEKSPLQPPPPPPPSRATGTSRGLAEANAVNGNAAKINTNGGSPSWRAVAAAASSNRKPLQSPRMSLPALIEDGAATTDLFSAAQMQYHDTSSQSFRSKGTNSRSNESPLTQTSPLTAASMTMGKDSNKQSSRYLREDSGLSEITMELADFNSPFIRNQPVAKFETITEETRRSITESSASFLTTDLPLVALNDTDSRADESKGAHSMSLSGEGSITVGSRTNASSSDDDPNWESFVHLGRKITTRPKRKSEILREAAPKDDIATWEMVQESEESDLEEVVAVAAASLPPPPTERRRAGSSFLDHFSNDGEQRKRPSATSETFSAKGEQRKRGSATSESLHSEGHRRKRGSATSESLQSEGHRRKRGSTTSENLKSVEGLLAESDGSDDWADLKSAPKSSSPKSKSVRSNGDLDKWEMFAEQDDSTNSSGSQEKWEVFDIDATTSSERSNKKKASAVNEQKWGFFDEGNADGETHQSRSSFSGESKKGTVASIPSSRDSSGSKMGTIASMPTRGLKKTASQKLTEAAIDKQSQQLLIMYLKSVGTSKSNAKEIATLFVQQQATRKGTDSFDEESAISGLSADQLADLCSHGDGRKAAMIAVGDSQRKLNSVRASAAPSVPRPSARPTAPEAPSSTNQQSERSRRRSRRRPPQLTWDRADAPGAVQMEGRAFGAPRRQEDAELPQTIDEEEGFANLAPETHVVEARAVKDTDEALPIVYADSSPLSAKSLLKEKGVRRIIACACLAVAVIIASTFGILLSRPTDQASAVGESVSELFPTSTPTMQPTFILEDILERAAELSGWDAVETPGSPQRNAVGWLSTVDQLATTRELGSAFIQRYALVVMYFAMNGEQWNDNQLWLDPTLQECEWSNTIFCTKLLVVNGMDFTRNNLSGTIPEETGLLESMEFLRMSKNIMLGGPIPNTLWDLPRIAVVDASSCQLTGTLASEVGNAASIAFLTLEKNALNGTLPDEIFTLPNVRVINLAENYFTGTLSSEIEEMAATARFSINDNLLSGPLPDLGSELGVLPRLSLLNLDRNDFTGSLPIWVTGHVTREEITASGNRFTGTISSTPAGGLSGVISIPPDSVVLKVMDFSDNQLTGELPFFGSFVQSLEIMSFSNNRLTGTLPFGGMWEGLKVFEASHNLITGELSSLPSILEELDVSNNLIQGGLPDSLCEAANLEILKVDNNAIGGSVTRFLECRENLEVFEAVGCQLTGSIPSSLPSNLEILILANNSITGTLPPELGALSKLSNFTVASNSMTGFIPSELGNAEKLEKLDLRDNLFWGTLPESLSQLVGLTLFGVSGNQLQGTVPVCETISANISAALIGCDLDCSCCDESCDGSDTAKTNVFEIKSGD